MQLQTATSSSTGAGQLSYLHKQSAVACNLWAHFKQIACDLWAGFEQIACIYGATLSRFLPIYWRIFVKACLRLQVSGDTGYCPSIVKQSQDVDLLVHEGAHWAHFGPFRHFLVDSCLTHV